jgi:hypothetical protein
MKRFRCLVLTAIMLSGCSTGPSYDRLEGPTVDLAGVDPVKYNKDMGECTQRKREASFVGSARMIGLCMEERGYTIITHRG